MAVKYFCDRCGREISRNAVGTRIAGLFENVNVEVMAGVGKGRMNNGQLCVSCVVQGVINVAARDETIVFNVASHYPNPPMSEADLLAHETIMRVLDEHRWVLMFVGSVKCGCGEVVYEESGSPSVQPFSADEAFRYHLAHMIVRAIQ